MEAVLAGTRFGPRNPRPPLGGSAAFARKLGRHTRREDRGCRSRGTGSTPKPGRVTGSPAPSTSTRSQHPPPSRLSASNVHFTPGACTGSTNECGVGGGEMHPFRTFWIMRSEPEGSIRGSMPTARRGASATARMPSAAAMAIDAGVRVTAPRSARPRAGSGCPSRARGRSPPAAARRPRVGAGSCAAARPDRRARAPPPGRRHDGR